MGDGENRDHDQISDLDSHCHLSQVVYLFLVSYQLIVMLMFTMVLVTIITTTMPIVAHLSVVCHQLVIEELDVFVFSHLASGLRIS